MGKILFGICLFLFGASFGFWAGVGVAWTLAVSMGCGIAAGSIACDGYLDLKYKT